MRWSLLSNILNPITNHAHARQGQLGDRLRRSDHSLISDWVVVYEDDRVIHVGRSHNGAVGEVNRRHAQRTEQSTPPPSRTRSR
ncbi:hypothetical protein ISS40_00550 [Candidatus Bathyarchaeota archaeon]|nr:hypothetical protein [Candidatus Bathyarchaeota archaeon]